MRRAAVILALAASAVGIYFYLRNASLSWAIPEEAGLDPALSGVSLVWGISALPIMIVFILLHIAFYVYSVSKKSGRVPVVISSLCWLCAITFDFYHH